MKRDMIGKHGRDGSTPHVPDEKFDARAILLARRRELLARHAALRADEDELLATSEPDWEDAAALRTAGTTLEHQGDLELAELRRIGSALERLDAGTYGRCTGCDGRIPIARLQAMPEAPTCATCADHSM
jgi:RNA polymerase-binding transcription factor DksA